MKDDNFNLKIYTLWKKGCFLVLVTDRSELILNTLVNVMQKCNIDINKTRNKNFDIFLLPLEWQNLTEGDYYLQHAT